MSTDIFAYEFGIRLGKHKLCPHISPKKSIEGSLFGLLFAVIIGTTVAYFAKTYEAFNINIFLFIPISLGLSIVSQIGDLVASKLKRTYDIKDYSNLFPGHGGVLDRFDSVIFVISTISIILLAMGL